MPHTHKITDGDLHFRIDPKTRAITKQAAVKIKLMRHDHNSERLTFELPCRFIDGHDMSLCDHIEIHYINVDSSTKATTSGVYMVEDMQIRPDGTDAVVFSWLISKACTKYAGTLNFRISFKCINEDGITLDYAWHTEIFKGVFVSDGMSNSEAAVEDYSDVLAAWEQKLLTQFNDINTALDAILAIQKGFIEGRIAYALSDDGTYYTCVGIGTYKGTSIVIPDEIDGIPVKRIADYAFQGNKKITSVVVGKNIDYVGKCAFEGCSNLTAIKLTRERYFDKPVPDWLVEWCYGQTDSGWCSRLAADSSPSTVASIMTRTYCEGEQYGNTEPLTTDAWTWISLPY